MSDQFSPDRIVSGLDVFDKYLKSGSIYLNTLEEISLIPLKCYHESCDQKIAFECNCSNIEFLICENHLKSHLTITDDKHKEHRPRQLNSEFDCKKWQNLVNYISNYNSDLRDLKKKLNSTVLDHFYRIKRQMDDLYKSIDKFISQNDQKLLYLLSTNEKTLENLTLLIQILESNFQKGLKSEIIEIPNDCLSIIQAEIRNSDIRKIGKNASEPETINKLPSVENAQASLEIESAIEVVKEPLLHWYEGRTDIIHCFDWLNNTQKKIQINGLSKLLTRGSRSISIDSNSILLCGRDDFPRTNESHSSVHKINLETQSFQKLGSMITGRYNFCMAFLNGFYYALGGEDCNWNKIKKCERYSLEDDTWHNIAGLNRPRCQATCVPIPSQNCIYLIGGKENGGSLNDKFEKYHEAFDNWTEIQVEYPILSHNLGSCLLPNSNLIFIFGGSKSNYECQKECYFYNYENDIVTPTNPMTSVLNDVDNVPVVFDNKVYCFIWNSNSERQIWIYDIELGDWLSSIFNN